MKVITTLGLILCIAGITLAGSRMSLPPKGPGAKPEAVKADGLVLQATGEFFEDRMPMRPVPKTPDDNAGRFHAIVKVTATNQGKKTVSNLSVSELVVYYGGTTREFCRIEPSLVNGTGPSASVAPGEQITLQYSGAPEKIGALRDSMEVYGRMVVTYGKGKQAKILTPQARVMITY